LPSFKLQRESGSIKYGFGYDHVTDVYKVVAFFHIMVKVFKTQGMVHTLGSNYWRMVHGELPLPRVCESLIFVSGALNWIAYKDDNNHSVISFDLVTELYRRLLQPNYGGEYVQVVNLGDSRDCLCIIACSPGFYSVWLMREYGNEES
jgi:F-box interacting protein